MNLIENTLSIKGRVQHVILHNINNGYTVLSVQVSKIGNISITCKTPKSPVKGETIIAHGVWTTYKGVRQLNASSISIEIDRSDSGILLWLKNQKIPGIGEKTIAKLGVKFRGHVFDVIEDVELLVAGGIKRLKAEAISNAWKFDKNRANFVSKMLEYGFNSKQIIAVEEQFGFSALEFAQKNPWIFSREIEGISFLTCDYIAERAGLDMTCPERIIAGLGWVLHDQFTNNGHCGVPREYLEFHASRLLKVSPEIITRMCSEFIDGEYIVEDKDVGLVYGRVLLDCEINVAKRLHDLKDRGGNGVTSFMDAENALMDAEHEVGLTLDREGGQFRAAITALTEPVMVITGGPGTGKSTIQKIIVAVLKKLGRTFILGAPTGRAAKRLSETSECNASTVHRILEFVPETSSFKYGITRPLRYDVIIIDEFSMVDLKLASSILNAMSMGTTLIMVGDFDQLTSVGPGQVLRDIIKSKQIPVVELTKIRRQDKGSGIALAASRVKLGIPPWQGEEKIESDFCVINKEDEDDIVETILRIMDLNEKKGFNIIEDIQVLASMKSGRAGVENLNLVIKNTINPVVENNGKSIKIGFSWFTINDRVMQISNNYSKAIFNGEVGKVDAIGINDANKAYIQVDFGGVKAKFTSEDIKELVMAYAVTVHKSQGCEFPVVIVSCPNNHKRMLSRNLLYTAMTRGRNKCYLVGTKETIENATLTIDSFNRFTALQKRLEILNE